MKDVKSETPAAGAAAGVITGATDTVESALKYSTNGTGLPQQPQDIAGGLRAILQPDQTFEIRILKYRKPSGYMVNISGYFTDPAKAAAAVKQYSGKANIYFMPNPVDPALLARANNRLTERPEATTADGNIAARAWVMVDVDPERAAGISATDQEKEAARAVTDQVKARLQADGWQPAIEIDSGNGYHLYYRADLPIDPAVTDQVKALLTGLAAAHDNDRAKVDTTVYNLARIMKLPGTMAVKGDSLPERPHRMARILKVDQDTPVITLDRLTAVTDKMAASLPPVATAKARPVVTAGQGGSQGGIAITADEIRAGLQAASMGWTEKAKPNGIAFRLADCLTSDKHSDGAALLLTTGGAETGKIAYKCNHDSCSGKVWADVRATVLPDRAKKIAHAEAAQNETAAAPDLMAQVDGLADVSAGRNLAGQAAGLDQVEWAELRDAIKVKTGATKGDLDAIYKERRKAAEQAAKAAADEAAKAARAERAASNPTFPYSVTDGCLTFDGLWGAQTIADFTASITTETTAEAGGKLFTITGRGLRGGAFTFEITAEAFNDQKQLTQAIGAAAGGLDPVAAGQGKHLAAAISKLTQADELREILLYDRVGWSGADFIISGRLAEGVSVSLPAKLPYDISGGDLAAGLAALENLLLAVDSELSAVILAAIFQAPLARLVGWDNERYALMVTGRTGSLKTSFCQCAMCIYGAGFIKDSNLVKMGEGATRNAIMAMATKANDMPFLIDNYKPNTASKFGNDFVQLLHNILEGGNKDRLTRNSVLMDAQPVFTFPVFTGEDVPDSDAATLARLLIVPFARPSGSVNDRLAAAQGAAEHLPAIGRVWLEWLIENEAEIKSKAARLFDHYRRCWVDYLTSQNGRAQNILRVATNLATNQITWALLAEHPDIGALAKRFTQAQTNGLERVSAGLLIATEGSLEAQRFINALAELIASGKAVLLPATSGQAYDSYDPDPARRVVGYQDEGGVYLLPEVTRAAIKRETGDDLSGMSNGALWRQLNEMGFIKPGTDGRQTVSKRLDGRVQRVLYILAGKILAEGNET